MIFLQDGEIWTFTVRAFDSSRPERTISVSYDGFAEGICNSVYVKVEVENFR